MKVRELMAILSKYNLDDLVVVARNDGASPLSEVVEMIYEADSTWFGELGMREITEEDRAKGYSEEDLGDENGEDCVVLWGIN